MQVRARIRSLDVYSGHADAAGLAAWVKARTPVAGRVFLAHGEPAALSGLRSRLVATGFEAAQIITPEIDESFALGRTDATQVSTPAPRIAAGVAADTDWHNLRAALLLELDQALEQAPDDRARERILSRAHAALAPGAARISA